MSITIVSVNHQLAPVDIREKVAFHQNTLEADLQALYTNNVISGCAILSTCNRSEVLISCCDDNIVQNQIFLQQWFADFHNIPLLKISPYLVIFSNIDAINHLSRVACGLDSLVLGEPQILGQLKESYQMAKVAKTLDKILEKLFQHIFSSAKHIRTQTKIGNSPISVAYCGVKLAQQIFSNLAEQTVLLIGANDMIRLSIEHFINCGVKSFIVANRTINHAKVMLGDLTVKETLVTEAIGLNQLVQYLHRADIVITSTASPVPILGKGIIETALKQRKRKPMFILDIAVPRDVESEVLQLEDVYLYTVDDLYEVVAQNKQGREQEKELALELLAESTQNFVKWLVELPREEKIKQTKSTVEKIKHQLLKQALKKIEKGQNPQEVISILADQLTNKLMHQTFIDIKTGVKK